MVENSLDRFKSANDPEAIKAALAGINVFNDAVAIRKALDLADDRRQETGLRILALQKLLTELAEDAGYIRKLMSILGDRTEPLELRTAALQLLKTLEFGSRTLKSLRPEYNALLRGLTSDPDPGLRASAVEILAARKDEFVQRLLIEGLNDPARAIVPPATAVQALRYDIHAEHFPILRRLAEDPSTDEGTRVEAIHVLAGDPAAKDLLIKLTKDRSESAQIRMSSIVALQAAHPADFLTTIGPILQNEQEDKNVRLRGITAILHHRDLKDSFENSTFLKTIEDVNKATRLPELQKLSANYLRQADAHLKKP